MELLHHSLSFQWWNFFGGVHLLSNILLRSPVPPCRGQWVGSGGVIGQGLARSVGGARASSRASVMEAASPRSSSTSCLHTEEKDLEDTAKGGSGSGSGSESGSESDLESGFDLCRKSVPELRVDETSLSQQATVRESSSRPRPSRLPWDTSWTQRA